MLRMNSFRCSGADALGGDGHQGDPQRPRGVGATLAVTDDSRVIGSISGGCIEGDAVLLGLGALTGGRPRVAGVGFGAGADPDDLDAPPPGLACAGGVEVIAYRLDPDDLLLLAALDDAAAGRGAVIGLVVTGPEAGRLLPRAEVAALVNFDPDPETGGRMHPGAAGGEDLLVLAAAARPCLLILGAGEHAGALCRLAAVAGFAVTVCDPWPLLVTRERFPDAEDLVVALPHEHLAELDPATLDARTAVIVLTHDERLDVPAILAALRLPVGFVGAMGARSTVARREQLLRAAGADDALLDRFHSPVGLDLGGRGADDTALSVLAEIVAARRGGTGRPLRERTGPVHRPPPTAAPPAAPSPGRRRRSSCNPSLSRIPSEQRSPSASSGPAPQGHQWTSTPSARSGRRAPATTSPSRPAR